MPINLTCPGCKAPLKLGDHLAGKKVKCPRCKSVFTVPSPEEEPEEQEDEGFAPVEVADGGADQRISHAPAHKARKRPARDEDEEEEEDDGEKPRKKTGIREGRERDRDERVKSSSSKARRKNADEEEDEDDEDEEEGSGRRSKKRGDKYKPCPKCGATGAEKVVWTAWGSFYGPALFTHVRCPECGYCYNGRTGRSNIVAAIIFVAVPLIGILAILGAVVYLFFLRGYLK